MRPAVTPPYEVVSGDKSTQSADVTRALGGLAWQHGVRGYDAVQLASALTWRESVGEAIVVATFDQQRSAAQRIGLKVWPDGVLPPGTR